MVEQLAIGSLVTALAILAEALFIALAIAVLTRLGTWLARPPAGAKSVLVLVCVTLWLMAAHSVGVWTWAITFLSLDVFETLEPALYFALVSFTTLGFGDITLTQEWRLLSGIAAANGLFLFGLSTAFLIELLNRLRQAQSNGASG